MTGTVQALTLWYLFWLGLAVGLTLLVMTSYRTISPRWLMWALLGSGALLISRYLSMALFATGGQPGMAGLLQRLWFGSAIGLTFPGMVALDQLVRHPAMTPKKLLRAYAPFLAVYVPAILLGSTQMTANPVIGLRPRLEGWAALALSVAQTLFVSLVVWLGAKLAKKLPSKHIRVALWALMAAYLSLALDGLLLACGIWYRWPFLYSEILTLIALWWAFETARQHPL